LEKLHSILKEYTKEKLEQNKLVSKKDYPKAYQQASQKIEFLYVDTNFIHFLDNISYIYTNGQNKDTFITILKGIGNILRLRRDSEQLVLMGTLPSTDSTGTLEQQQIRTLYANFEETLRLKDIVLNHFQSILLTIPKSKSSYMYHQQLLDRLHKLLLRAVDIQRNYNETVSMERITTSTKFLPNKNVYTKNLPYDHQGNFSYF
jgi:hypothetical protein